MLGSDIDASNRVFTPRFLEGISPALRNVILAAASSKHLPANSIVANQGNPSDHLYLLAKGRARFFYLTDGGRKLLLQWLTPGAVFGTAALLSKPSPHIVSTETVKDSHLLVWDRTTIRALSARCPRLLENALLIGYDDMTWYVADRLALTTNKAEQRLARILVYLAELVGQKVRDGYEFDVTNEELASAANITSFTASRLLKEWQNNRTIVKRRGKIILLSRSLSKRPA
jgi:CRP/FNR family transcriptional regulator, nitrogen oxide reductase regulator